MATFGQRLRQLRKEKQLTSKELSRDLKIAQSTLSRYENELREPRRDFLEIASKYFNVSIDYILGKTDAKSTTHTDYVKEDSVSYNTFDTKEDAVKFLLKQPTLASFGGYDLNKLSDEELIDFANDLLQQIQLVSLKYKK